MERLPAAAKRVQEAAERLGLAISVTVMPDSTRTAAEAAQACGCTVSQIVKSLIFKGKNSDRAYLFLVSGTNRVDEKAMAETIGEEILRPDADFVRKSSGFAIGGIPPFGHAADLPTFLDRDLLQFGTVWAAAGTPRAVFAIDPGHLRDALVPRVIQFG